MSNIQSNINQMISSAAIATNLAKSVEEQKKASDEAAKANAIKQGEMKAESDALKAQIGSELANKEQDKFNAEITSDTTKEERRLVDDIVNDKVKPEDVGFKSGTDAVYGISTAWMKRAKDRVEAYRNSPFYKEMQGLRDSKENISRWQLVQARANEDLRNVQIENEENDKKLYFVNTVLDKGGIK